MDKNSLVGLLLIGAIIIGFSIYNSPSKQEVEKYRHEQDSTAAVQKLAKNIAAHNPSGVVANDSASVAKRKEQLGTFASAAEGTNQYFTLENELVKVTLSTKGGKVSSVELKKYKTYQGKPVILFNGDSVEQGLRFSSQNKNINTNDLYFTSTGQSFAVSGTQHNSISMRLNVGENKYIEYVYTLAGNAYDVGFTLNSVGMGDMISSGNSMNLLWKVSLLRQEKNIEAERLATTVYYRSMDKEVDYLTERKDAKETLKNDVKWVSFKEQYFTSVLIADKSFEKPLVESAGVPTSNTATKTLSAEINLPYTHQAAESIGMRFYFGPNHYNTLKKYDLDLQKQIPLGWGIFGWVNRFIVIPVFNFLASFNMNYGIIILILTIVFKVLLLPLTYKAYLSQAKMKVLKPEVDEIQSRKAEDPMKTQQEMMSLYKKAGVNPLGGCFPLVLQMPILLALFRFFPSSIELRQQSFLWAKDLSTYDSVLDFGFKIPFYGDHISLFTLLMTISTLIYTRMNNQFTGANAQMKWMGYLMPIVFLGVFNNYAAGLSYYYFLANMLTFGQQYLFRTMVDEKAIHEKIQENKKRPATKSKFQQKMEEMAKARGGAKPSKK